MDRALKYVSVLMVLVLVASASTALIIYYDPRPNETSIKVGIAFCGNTTAEAKLLIDRTKSYTNLFILNSAGNPINRNQTMIEEIGDYATANDLNIIINLGFNSTGQRFPRNWFWSLSSLDGIKQRWTERWGKKFLGIYYSDEPGGIQLDGDWDAYFAWLSALSQNPNSTAGLRFPSVYVDAIHSLSGIYDKIQAANGSTPDDYDEEADFFISDVIRNDPGFSSLKKSGFTTFTSDYGLYWFDYLGGYDVMFAQIGWNCSLAQQIGLVKGAARTQNKEWGVIITWKYGDYPYLDSGDQIYNQMMTAYQAGADYIVMFNYPILEGNDYGLMEEEHFLALERFWNDAIEETRIHPADDSSVTEAVLVLPRNYGWGMRRPDDLIWGFWGPDEKSIPIGTLMGKLIAKYGVDLEIIYEDSAYSILKSKYKNVYYWNSTL
ncbi:TPA: hypothetical protein HA273_00685 [Candidatus Bathyarchaeota archaeon]|nr:hypothetical protein [Candidatus Bathyarchaeota archaeon]